jgi:lantibiotic modifying enzyme
VIASTSSAWLRRYVDVAAELFTDRLAGPCPAAVTGSVIEALTERLSRLAGPVLAASGDPDAYPVLDSLLDVAGRDAAEAAAEVLERFTADRDDLIAALFDGIDPGEVVALRPGLGDPHRGGRTVTSLRFADGRRIVCKPRDVRGEALLAEVAAWLGERLPSPGLLAAAVLPRMGYGWMQFIASEPLADAGQATEFYRRAGVLLAVAYALHATDLHGENIVAHGAHPVLIDAETLLHPRLPRPHHGDADPAASALDASVRSTGLIPFPMTTPGGPVDMSGLGATLANRPVLDGRPLEPAEYIEEILDGFQHGYDAIRRHRAGFRRLIEAYSDMDVRVVARQTSGYRGLLDHALQPEALRDPADRDACWAPLAEASAGHPLWRRLVPSEFADLAHGDIPIFFARAGSRDLRSTGGEQLPGLVERSGLDCAYEVLDGLDEVNRRDQEWTIAASLATRPAGPGPRTAPAVEVAVAAEPSRLRTAACGLADQIIAAGRADPAGRINWPGLQLVEDSAWMVLPMGAGLGEGYLGVALFLAQTARLTGIDRYAQAARQALVPLPRLLGLLDGRPDLIAAIGPGATEGLGGIGYGLARIATLLDAPEYAACAEQTVTMLVRTKLEQTPAGWTTGVAGGLAALSALRDELPGDAAGKLADEWAAWLIQLVEDTDGRCVPPDRPVVAGFAAGPAGVGAALLAYAADGAPEKAARKAMSRATADPSPGWHSGEAGVLLARHLAAPQPPATARRLAAEPLRADLSLCHGEMGVAETMSTIAEPIAADLAPVLRRRAGLLLDALARRAGICGTPGGVATPGLLRGLAGIGYGLLRLSFPEVPSVLLLSPTPRPDPAAAKRVR